MDSQQALVDRAVKQLAEPALAKLRSGRRIEKILVTAQKTGELSVDELREATRDLVREADVPRHFAKAKEGSADEANSGLAILFLLILLSILLALVGDDSDLAVLIQDLIDRLLGRPAANGR